MSTIVLRSVKGTPLTNTEVDANFSNLNTDKIQIGGSYSTGTAAGVLYLNGSKVLTTGTALTFDGTTLGSTALNVTGNTTLGDATTDTVTVNGYMGVGTGPNSTIALYARGYALSGPNQTGVYSYPTGTSAATANIRAFSAQLGTAAEVFTVSQAASFFAADPVKGAGSTITNLHGLYIVDQTQGTNNYGITSLVTSGTNKWNIYASGTADNYFAGDVGIGTSTSLNASVNTSVSTTKAGYSVHSSGGSGATTGLMFSNTGSYGFIDYDPSSSSGVRFSAFGPLRFGSNTNAAYGSSTFTEAMRITGGNVGIGTSSPAYRLDVVESADSEVSLRVSNQNTGANSIASLYLQGQGNNFYIRNYGDGAASANRTDFISTAGSSYFTFSPTSAEAMRITSAGNVGIGTSSPVGNLDVAGTTPTLNIRDTQSKVSWAAGDIVATLDFYSNDTSGVGAQAVSRIRSVADTASAATSGALAFWTAAAGAAATEKVRITSAGSMGIGTTSPSATLDVVGETLVQGRLQVTAASPELLLTVPAGGLDSRIYNDGSGNLIFGNGTNSATPTERMRLDASGNVGIGTSSPRSLLNPSGSGSTGAVLTLENSNTALTTGNVIGEIDFYANDASTNGTGAKAKIVSVIENSAGNLVSLTFATSDSTSATGVERMRIDSSGNLGLGVTPSAWGATSTALQNRNASFWATNAAAYLGYNYFFDGSARKYIASSFATEYTQLNGQHIWYNAPSGTADAAITFTQAMTLDASGNLGIGTSAPAFASGSGLEIERDSTNATLRLQRTGTSPSSMEIRSGANTGEIFVTSNSPLLFATNGTERARIDASGNVQVQAGAVVVWAPAPASISTTATLTNANIQGQIINTTGTSYTVTMPLGTTMETLVPWAAVNLGYDFTVINTASGTITMAINTGVTSLGGLTIATGTSAQFRIRRTATNTFVLYRMG